MKNWGYKIQEDRSIIWEEGDFSILLKVRQAEPSVNVCISCGTCSSACTAAQFTDFSLRRVIINLQRGRLDDVRKEIKCCLLCGKCQLSCPRNVNTRNVIIQIRKELQENGLR